MTSSISMSAISEGEKGWNGVLAQTRRYYGEDRLRYLTTSTYRRARFRFDRTHRKHRDVCATRGSLGEPLAASRVFDEPRLRHGP